MIKIKIGHKTIGENKPIFYIAEAGVNHNGSLAIAKKLINTAKKYGADAIKFQSFLADEIIIPKGPKAKYHDETVGKKTNWYDLLKKQEISIKMHKFLISYCKKKQIIFLSTPYDYQSALLLNKLGVNAFKIASTDNNNFPLIEKIVKFRKPIIISTAMTNFNEVEDIVKFFRKLRFKKYIILQCTGSYPSKTSDANLRVLQIYKKKFKCLVGYSDHTPVNTSAIVSVGLGAKVIEKHFTINKKMWGPDHRMSLSPKELKKSIQEVRLADTSLGKAKKEVLMCEKENRNKLKKSLVFSRNMKKYEKIRLSDLKIKRPGTGIGPKLINKVIGLRLKKNIKANTLIKFASLKK
tara:strand:- start:41 stop:1093 length:1053 start_codon:yes stop_codon:yes gene_type:complete